MNKIKGVFAFDTTIDFNFFADNCKKWGLDTAILHPGFFSGTKMVDTLEKNRINPWLNLPVFYNPEFLETHPDYYSITSRGQRAIHDWCHFICPSREDYLENFIRENSALIARLQPKLISLDFIRFFVFWELVNINGNPEGIEDGCYCPLCLESFGRYLGEKIPSNDPVFYIHKYVLKEWGNWKTEQITRIAAQLIKAFREVSLHSKFWIKTVPWKKEDLKGGIRFIPGQDVLTLANLVDGIIPMAFTHILNQTPAWKEELLSEIKRETGKPVFSYVQVDKVIRPEDIPLQHFEEELRASLSGDNAGIIVFHYEQLLNSTERALILQHNLIDLLQK